MHFFTELLSVLALAVSTTATPLHVTERSDLAVLSPHILQPQGSDQPTYYVGSTQVCCWETDRIPAKDVNKTGSLILGHYVADGTNSPHLNYKHPLSSGFRLIAGCVNYVVPDVLAGDSFFIVLGDPSNMSGLFTIQPNPDSGS